MSFCDGLCLYQAAQKSGLLADVVENYSEASSVHQRQQLIFDLVKPVLLDEEKSTDSVGYFTGAYNLDELEKFFDVLQKTIDSFSFNGPISFSLLGQFDATDEYHAIELSYDVKEKIWYFTNISSLPTFPIHSTKELANEVISAFFTFNCAIFATVPTSLGEEKEKLQSCIEALWLDKAWVKMHSITPEKAALRTNTGASWRRLAIHFGDPITVMEIDELGGILHQWKRKGVGASIGGLIGFSVFGPMGGALGAYVTSKLISFGTTTLEHAIAMTNSQMKSFLPQLPTDKVDITNKESSANQFRINFIETWQKTHAPETKSGTMLQNRKRF